MFRILVSGVLGIVIYYLFYIADNIELVLSVIIPIIVFMTAVKIEEVRDSSHKRDAKILALLERRTNRNV